MANYTYISSHTISLEREKLWNPIKTLGIINPDKDCLTCVGFASSCGRRCRNPIRAENRTLIMRSLDEMAYLPPDSLSVMLKLRAVSRPALCVRYHQSQAETVVTQWQRIIQLLSPQIREQKPTKPVERCRPQTPPRDRRLQDIQDQFKNLKEIREAMAKLDDETDSSWQTRRGCEEPENRAVKSRREEEEEHERRRSEERDTETRRRKRDGIEKDRLGKKRLEEEKRQGEEKQRREREEAATNERIQQRARTQKMKRELEKQKEREEWDRLWAKYQDGWVQYKASESSIAEGNIRDAIPWPVESGLYRDVKSSNVREFFQKAVRKDGSVAKLMRKECLKWHPDRWCSWLLEHQLSNVNKIMINMICRVVTELLSESAGRSSKFLD